MLDFNFSGPRGGYNPTGFAGRQSNSYIQPTYFNPDTGRIQNSPYMPGASQPTQAPAYGGMPPSGMDFFSQLAGLVGGGMGPAPVQAPPTAWFAGGPTPLPANVDPEMLRAKMAFYGGPASRLPGGIPVKQPNQGNLGPVITPGGQGPYGGVSREVQQGMFQGRAQASSRSAGTMPSQQFGQPMQKRQPSSSYGGSQSPYRSTSMNRSSFGYGRSF